MSIKCYVIARPGEFEVVATGLRIKATHPVVAAARYAQATANLAIQELIIGVEGVHGGFSVCEARTKSTSIVAPVGQSMRAMRFVGLSDNAEIGSVTLWKKDGNPGPLAFDDLIIRASNLTKHCILSAKQNSFDRCGITLRRVILAQWGSTVFLSLSRFWTAMRAWLHVGDGQTKAGALWGVRGHGDLLYVELDQVVSDGFGEHGLVYVDNVQQRVSVSRSKCTDSARTAVQIVNREWADKNRTSLTNSPSTPESATASVHDCEFVDCGSYPDAAAKGGQMANGSAITVAGFPGSVSILRNRIKHTHPGGGGIAVFPDWPKIGSFKTHDGFATGDVSIQGNVLDLQAGAAAGREAVQIGGCRSVTLGGNSLIGTEKRVTLNHGGKIGKVIGTFEGAVP